MRNPDSFFHRDEAGMSDAAVAEFTIPTEHEICLIK